MKKITQIGTSYIATMLQYLYKKKPHQNLTLSFYICTRYYNCQVLQEDYTESEVEHDPEWCYEKFKSPNFKGQCSFNMINLTIAT